MDQACPDLDIPFAARHIWEWYFEVSDAVDRRSDGKCCPIPPSEFEAWARLSGNIVYPHEYAILRTMDAVYCDEMNKELQDYHTRTREQQKKDMDEARKSYGRSR